MWSTLDDWVFKKQNQIKNKTYEDHAKNGRTENDYLKLQTAINDVSEIIDKRKNDYNWHLHQNQITLKQVLRLLINS